MASISKFLPRRFIPAGGPLRSPLAPGAILVALLAVTPLLSLLWLALDGGVAHWTNLLRYVLPQATLNTLLLLLGVALLAGAIGVGCAWAVSAFQFPGRRLLTWGLLLPLAMPTYIVAFSWLDLLHPIGPLQSALRLLLGYDSPRQFRLPDIRSVGGAIVLFSLVLYPYVYLTMRAMFISQPAHLLEAARTLGENGRTTFWRVVLPLAHPALAVGISLALLETLNDLGASEFLGVQTLTVAVYTTWITRSDIAAAQIACMMLGFIFLLLTLEMHGRRRQRYAGRGLRTLQPQPLHGARAWLLTAVTALPLLLGFVVPLLHLIGQSIKRLESQTLPSGELLSALSNTLILALSVTLLAVAISLALAWYARIRALAPASSPLRRLSLRLASLGYAVPGTILAIGFMPPALYADRWLAGVLGDTRPAAVLLRPAAGALLYPALPDHPPGGIRRRTGAYPAQSGAGRPLPRCQRARDLLARTPTAAASGADRERPAGLRRHHEGAADHPAAASGECRNLGNPTVRRGGARQL